ncbi:MAG: glycosyltransferase family 87 protein [Sphingomicrobium sp.]
MTGLSLPDLRRIEPRVWLLLGLTGVGACLVIIYALALQWPPIGRRDYATYWLAGRMVLDGANPYDPQAISAAARGLSDANALQPYFSYPPQALLLFVPLGALPLVPSYWTYQAMGFGLFFVAAKPYLPKGFPLLALLSPAAIVSFDFGQSGMLLAALWLFSFSGSAAATAALTFRPQLGVLAGFEAVRGRTLIWTFVWLMLAVAISSALFGIGIWQDWLQELQRHSRLLNGNQVGWYRQMPVPLLGYGPIGWLMFGGAALFFLSRAFNAFTAATAAILVAPHGFHYDMTAVCFSCAVMLFDRWNDSSLGQRVALSAAFLTPALVYFGTWLVPPILLWALYEQAELSRSAAPDEVGRAHRTRRVQV